VVVHRGRRVPLLRRPPRSDDHGYRLDRRCDAPQIVLGHDHNARRLDTPTAPSEIGSIFGCHRHGRFLVLQALPMALLRSSSECASLARSLQSRTYPGYRSAVPGSSTADHLPTAAPSSGKLSPRIVRQSADQWYHSTSVLSGCWTIAQSSQDNRSRTRQGDLLWQLEARLSADR
jgi:hypothetical protein